MKKIALLMALGIAVAFSSTAQTPDYKARIAIINKNIAQSFYDKSTGLYLETNNEAENKGNHSFCGH